MNLIAILRKLGILRYGTYKGTYTSGKDMSAEMLMDDVYDADKDLVSGGNKKKSRDAQPNEE